MNSKWTQIYSLLLFSSVKKCSKSVRGKDEGDKCKHKSLQYNISWSYKHSEKKLKVTFTESMTVENYFPLKSTIGSKYDLGICLPLV